MRAAMIVGWVIAAALGVCWAADSAYLKALVKFRENARDIWHNEANRLAELVLDRENAIAHMHMEIEALTPKRNARGKFVAKDAEL